MNSRWKGSVIKLKAKFNQAGSVGVHALGIDSLASIVTRVTKRIVLAGLAYATTAAVVDVVHIHVRISAYKRSAMRHAPRFRLGKLNNEEMATDSARKFAGLEFK